MEETKIRIRTAGPDDAEQLLAIYAPYVEKTAITFEYEVPDVKEFRDRIRRILKRYPYLVAEISGEAVGYVYLDSFIGRKAYDWSASVSIYVKEQVRKTGIGRALYQAVEEIARAQHITNLNACIGYPETEDEYLTKNSAQFHAHMGYRLVGEFRQCGYKFGRWYNMIWMEKMIGEHEEHPKPFIPFPELPKSGRAEKD